jgi:hypothetical protein
VKESKKGSKTEMCGENLSLAKELKVVNKPNTTYPVGGRQCTDYIKEKKSISQNSYVKIVSSSISLLWIDLIVAVN